MNKNILYLDPRNLYFYVNFSNNFDLPLIFPLIIKQDQNSSFAASTQTQWWRRGYSRARSESVWNEKKRKDVSGGRGAGRIFMNRVFEGLAITIQRNQAPLMTPLPLAIGVFLQRFQHASMEQLIDRTSEGGGRGRRWLP